MLVLHAYEHTLFQETRQKNEKRNTFDIYKNLK